MIKEVTFFPGLEVKCWKVQHGNNTNISIDKIYQGEVPLKPTEGFRFRVSKLDTSGVKEILEETDKGGKFKTHSDSIYAWEVIRAFNDKRTTTRKVDMETGRIID